MPGGAKNYLPFFPSAYFFLPLFPRAFFHGHFSLDSIFTSKRKRLAPASWGELETLCIDTGFLPLPSCVKKRVSEKVSPRIMHVIWPETLGKTLGETLWHEKSRQESQRESQQDSWRDFWRDFSRRDSRQDSWRDSLAWKVSPRVSERVSAGHLVRFFDVSCQRVSPRVLLRVSDRIICMTLSETLFETFFYASCVLLRNAKA